MKKRRVSLDCIRIVAMFCIITYHWNAYCLQQDIQIPYIGWLTYANGNFGDMGVSLFFILSGASLMYAHREKLPLGPYLKKRFLSIYPLYWVSYAAFFFYIYVLRGVSMQQPVSLLIYSVLGMDGFLHYKIPTYYIVGEWFVGCIVLIYLIFPILYKCVCKAPAVTALVVAGVYPIFVHYYPFQMEIMHFPLGRIPELMIGMYFIKYYDRFGERTPSKWISGLLTVISAVSLIVIFWYPLYGVISPYREMWIGVSAFLFLYHLFQLLETVDEKKTRWIVQLAGCSYGMFLIHHILQGEFLSRLAGVKISWKMNYGLFMLYLAVLWILTIILGKITSLMVKSCEKAWDRIRFCMIG